MAQVRVRWIDAPAPSIGNKILRNDIEITDIGLGLQEYVDSNAPDDATPKYEVQSYDAEGNETTQEVEGVNMDYITTPPIDPVAPDAPTSLVAGTPTSSTIPLTWTKSATGAMTNYRVYIGGVLQQTFGDVAAGTLTGLTAGTAYNNITVRAFDGLESTDSNSINVSTAAGGSYGVEYQAILDQAGLDGATIPSTPQQVIQDALIKALQDDSAIDIFAEMDVFYCVYNDGSQEFSNYNWKAPASYELLPNGGVSWLADTGYTNDRTGFLNTQFVPGTDGVNVTQNDASYGCKVEVEMTTFGSAQVVFGAADGTSSATIVQLPNLGQVYFFNNTLSQGVLTTGGAGLTLGTIAVERNSSAGHQYYQSGVQMKGEGDVSSGLPNQSIYIGGENSSGSLNAPSNVTWSFFWAGSSLAAYQDEINALLVQYVADIDDL